MRRAFKVLAMLAGVVGSIQAAEARVAIRVDLSSQTMYVSGASGDYTWPISSARMGYSTPRGTFGVKRMETMHYSRKYHNSPMPHSLFFSGGYAIHGTYATASLGQPASHGCIRIAPENAAALYDMVRSEGGAISITGNAPASENRYARRDSSPVYASAGRRRFRGTQDGNGFFYDPSQSLGYAPQVAPGFYQWVNDPTADY